MTNPEAILQVARLVGQDGFQRCLGLDGALPLSLTAEQIDRIHALIDERGDLVAQGLIEEAMASDDVQDAASALAYLDDRLRFLGGLLTAQQRERIRSAFAASVASWG